MFYSGWAFYAPTSMNVGALSAEMHHARGADHSSTSLVSQEMLVDVPLSTATATTSPSSAAAGTTAADGAAAVRGRHAPPDVPSSVKTQTGSGSAGAATKTSRSVRRGARLGGCVLHFSPRPSLSYKEMEQQLQRRAAGASECFHVKSDVPILARSGVLFMECVVGPPSAFSSGLERPAGAEPTTAAGAAPAGKGDGRAPATRRESREGEGKHPVPALVIGVCQRQLPWFNLPGEASNSIGFYVAQRHIVKHGGDDRDEVVVPCDSHNSHSSKNNNSGGGGGGRVCEGDAVGCLVDLLQHTLSFTVNQQIVSTHSMDPAYEDGSLYLAIGMARRPQHATDVRVRFFTGSSCLQTTTPHRRHASGEGRSSTAVQQEQTPGTIQPCFPLLRYVRALAIAAVRQRTLREDGDAIRDGEGAAGIGDAGESSTEVQDFMAALASRPRASRSSADASDAAAAGGTPSEAAVRDVRVAAVLRDYLAARGMNRTLHALDSEMDALVPTQAQVYPTAHPRAAGDKAGESTFNENGRQSSTLPTVEKKKDQEVQALQNGAGRVNKSGAAATPPLQTEVTLACETRAAWQAYADNMAALRRTLLTLPTPPSHTTATPPLLPSERLTDLLLKQVLWKPSLVCAFAFFFESRMSWMQEVISAAPAGQHTEDPSKVILKKPPGQSTRRHAAETETTATAEVLPEMMKSACCSSPYTWFCASVDPALLTLSFLTLRQDVRYLLHAHCAVQELWRMLRTHLRRFKSRLETVRVPPTVAGTFEEGMETAAGMGNAARKVETEEDEENELVAFTTFFTQLMWDPQHALPSAITHVHRAWSRDESDVSRAAAVAAAAAAPVQASPLPLHVKAMEALAGLSGHTTELHEFFSFLPGDADTPSDEGMMGGVTSEAKQFCALAAAHNTHRFANQTSTASNLKSKTKSSSCSAKGGSSCEKNAVAVMAPTLEEAVLFLYSRAVVPASAPPRSAQVRLLQTLCSLFSHTLSTLRQIERMTVPAEQDNNTNNNNNNDGGADDSQMEMRPGSTRAALACVGAVENLLVSVERRCEQLVWWRLAHALEDVNKQLLERLDVWQTALESTSAEAVASRTAAGKRQDARQRHEPIHEWATEYDLLGDEEEAADVEQERRHDEDSGSDNGAAAHAHQHSPSLTASFSSFRGQETSEEAEEDDEVRGDASAVRDAVDTHHMDTSYEALTRSLPSLRLLWRRVAARAALAPSQHLVTDLFVHELKASLAFAPRDRWREGHHKVKATRDGHEASTPAVAPPSKADNGARSGENVGVKRRISSDVPARTASDVNAVKGDQPTGGVQDAGKAMEAHWFTEELYLSSVYMKRVLKHLGGR